MRLPRRINEILKKKELFLDDMRAKLENTALRLQGDLFEQLIEEIIPRLEIKDGIIIENAHNYRLITELNKIYDTFNTKVVETILPQINQGTQFITGLTNDYFIISLGDNIPKRFNQIIESTRVLTDLRIGLREEKLIRGGLLESMLKSDKTTLQQALSKAVTSRMSMKDFIKEIKNNITGTEEKLGSLQRQFQRFTYDTYQQYDRAYNKKLAEEFDLQYFVYQGGLIKDSRDFCVCHNGKVFSVDEAQSWETWTPGDCEYPAGYEVKAKDLSAIPSYLGFAGYDPLVDAGGYNCRHILGFISDELAVKMRPDLKKEI